MYSNADKTKKNCQAVHMDNGTVDSHQHEPWEPSSVGDGNV